MHTPPFEIHQLVFQTMGPGRERPDFPTHDLLGEMQLWCRTMLRATRIWEILFDPAPNCRCGYYVCVVVDVVVVV